MNRYDFMLARNAPEPMASNPADERADQAANDMTDEELAAELEGIEEAQVEEIAETLPAPLTSAEVTERELRRLEAYRGEVLADVTDAKAAKALDTKRIEVKKTRTTAARICKSQREEAIRVQREWVAVERAVTERLEVVESHLEDEIARHDAWKTEQARKAEAERQARIRARVEQVVRLGAEIEMDRVEGLTDEEWESYAANLEAIALRRREAEARAARLTEAGDECSPEEAGELTEDQYALRLQVAQQAKREREELARIQAEEKAERERKDREEREQREREEAERVAAIEAENARLRAESEAQAAELRRLREEQEERQRQADEEARRVQEEADRKAREEREAAEAEVEAQIQRVRESRQAWTADDRAAVKAWARNALDTMPSTPAISDEPTLARMRHTVDAIRTALLDLEDEMGATRGGLHRKFATDSWQYQRNAVED